MRDLVDELVQEFRNEFPGDLPEESARYMTSVMMGLTILHPNMDREEGGEKTFQIIMDRTEQGDEQAQKTLTDVIRAMYGPSHEKAVKVGVDPIVVMCADTGCTEEEARSALEVLKS